MTKPSIAGIILAAGLGSRMGRTKQLLDYKGKPILAHVIDHCARTDLDPLILVLGHNAGEIQKRLKTPGPLPRSLKTIVNPAYKTGMASSIRRGIEALPPPVSGTLFLLGDQPGILPALIQAILEKAMAFPDKIIVPGFRGRKGNPVYFGKTFFTELTQVSGDQGGRSLFSRFPDQILYVESPTDAVCWDLDTPEDYERLCRQKEMP